jgi:hypothetical protein
MSDITMLRPFCGHSPEENSLPSQTSITHERVV